MTARNERSRYPDAPLHILTVHNRYKQRGGEDESREAEDRILRERGHQIDEFVCDNSSISGAMSKWRTGLNAVWSNGVYRQIRNYLRAHRPDLVDVHNFFPQISPAVHYAAAAEGVPTMQTFHNYRLACPAATYYRDGEICEECSTRFIKYPAVVHRCYRGSAFASAATATMLALHSSLRTWQTHVDAFIAVSQFTADKMSAALNLPPDKIHVKPNFVHPAPQPGRGEGNYAIFAGRLAPEKGIRTLIAGWQLLQSDCRLRIVGDGPLERCVREAADRDRRIEYCGRFSIRETYAAMGSARFLICPSEWYEAFGRVVVEAFAVGTPVLTTRLGGLPELVSEGENGMLFTAGDARDLARKAAWLIENEACVRMRTGARTAFETFYTAEANYVRMLEIYGGVLARRRQEEQRTARQAEITAVEPVISDYRHRA